MVHRKIFTLTQVSEITGIDESRITTFIHKQWISPVEVERAMLDEEDIARIHLIEELQAQLGANDESIPIILHLIDQLYSLRERVKNLARSGPLSQSKPSKID